MSMQLAELAANVSAATGRTVTSLKPVGDYAQNLNYIVSIDSDTYFLKLYSVGSGEEREFEQKVLAHLNNNPATRFVPVAQEPGVFSLYGRPAMLFNVIAGKTLGASDITDEVLVDVARKQAAIHHALHGTVFGVKERFNPLTLDFAAYFNLSPDDEVAKDGLRLLRELESVDDAGLITTLIHDDLSPSNIMAGPDGVLHFIDFDDAHYSLRVSDIGTAIKELILPTWGYDVSRIDSYLAAYDGALPKSFQLTAAERALLPLMILRRALFMYAYYSSLQPGTERNLHVAAESGSIHTIQKAQRSLIH